MTLPLAASRVRARRQLAADAAVGSRDTSWYYRYFGAIFSLQLVVMPDNNVECRLKSILNRRGLPVTERLLAAESLGTFNEASFAEHRGHWTIENAQEVINRAYREYSTFISAV